MEKESVSPHTRHPDESRDPVLAALWVPAFAGMTLEQPNIFPGGTRT